MDPHHRRTRRGGRDRLDTVADDAERGDVNWSAVGHDDPDVADDGHGGEIDAVGRDVR